MGAIQISHSNKEENRPKLSLHCNARRVGEKRDRERENYAYVFGSTFIGMMIPGLPNPQQP